MHIRRMCILLLLDEIFCVYLLISSGLMCCLRSVFPYRFCCLDDLSIDLSVVLKSSTIIVLLSIPLCLLLFAYIFMCSYVGCINAYQCYILLVDSPLYHCVMPFFAFYYSLCLKVYFF